MAKLSKKRRLIMDCPRCGSSMDGGICPECGFPIARYVKLFNTDFYKNITDRAQGIKPVNK